MIVKDLIARLQKFDENLEVLRARDDEEGNGYDDVYSVHQGFFDEDRKAVVVEGDEDPDYFLDFHEAVVLH